MEKVVEPMTCPECDGTGYLVCEVCDGSGQVDSVDDEEDGR